VRFRRRIRRRRRALAVREATRSFSKFGTRASTTPAPRRAAAAGRRGRRAESRSEVSPRAVGLRAVSLPDPRPVRRQARVVVFGITRPCPLRDDRWMRYRAHDVARARQRRVHLVSRCVFGDAHVTPGKVWFFIPDLHLCPGRPPHSTTTASARTARTVASHQRGPLLFELCESSAARPDGATFRFQLGLRRSVPRGAHLRPIRTSPRAPRHPRRQPGRIHVPRPEARLNTSLVLEITTTSSG
jgi:hypothetical protein